MQDMSAQEERTRGKKRGKKGRVRVVEGNRRKKCKARKGVKECRGRKKGRKE